MMDLFKYLTKTGTRKTRKTYKLFSNRMKGNSREVLDASRDVKIVKIEVLFKVLRKLILQTINVLSLGQFSSHNNYSDGLLHAKLLIHLENGQKVVLDKGATVRLTQSPKHLDSSPGIERIVIPCRSRNLTLGTLYDNTLRKMGTKKFFSYDPSTNNCQDFVYNVLLSNQLMRAKDTFLKHKQNTQKVFKKHKIIRRAISGLNATSLGRFVDSL